MGRREAITTPPPGRAHYSGAAMASQAMIHLGHVVILAF